MTISYLFYPDSDLGQLDQHYRQTDRWTTYNGNTALALCA